MFDLNELPNNDGSLGRGSLLYTSSFAVLEEKAEGEEEDADVNVVAAVAAADEEEEEEDEEEEVQVMEDEEVDGAEEEQVYYGKKGSEKKILRLLPDGRAGNAKGASQGFLRLDSSSSACYGNDWQPLEVAAGFDESEIDTDNEVTVAALDANAILDSECVSGLDSAVSLVVPTTPCANFGISPLPEKLGQRTQASRKRPDFTNIRRLDGKWNNFSPGKRGGVMVDGEPNSRSRKSLLYPALVSTRKGKRVREDGSHSVADNALDNVVKIKRYGRPPSTPGGSGVYLGAGPSLSMGLDQDAVAIKSPFPTTFKGPSKDFRREAAPSPLSLSEAPTGVHRAVPLNARNPNLGLSMAMSAIGNNGERDGDPDAAKDSDEEGVKLSRELDAFANAQAEKPFWQGQLCADGFGATNVAAYCSEDIQSASKLRSLPQVVMLEHLVKIEEFLTVVKKVNVSEPLIRLRLLSDAAANNRQSFSSLVRSLSIKKNRAKGFNGSDLKVGLQDASLAWREGPLGSAGAEYVFVASLTLKQSKDTGRKLSAKLYLLLGSSCEAISDLDREVGRKLLDELDWSHRSPQNTLFGFLSVTQESGRLLKSGVVRDAELLAANGNASFVSPELQSSRKLSVPNTPGNMSMEKSDGKLAYRDIEGIARAEIEESTMTDGIQSGKSKDQKTFSVSSIVDKTKARSHGRSYNYSPMEDDNHIDRDRPRDRDRDLRNRGKDPRGINKDFQRYSLRSFEKTDMSKRDRSKDKELERFRDRDHHRDSHRDIPERWKSGGRERFKELEKEKQREKERHRDRERELERERSIRKRARSADPEKSNMENSKLVAELGKATTVNEGTYEHFVQQDGTETRKRVRVNKEDPSADNTNESEIKPLQAHNDVADSTKPTLNITGKRMALVPGTDTGREARSAQVDGSVQEYLNDPQTGNSGLKMDVGVVEGADGEAAAEHEHPADSTKDFLVQSSDRTPSSSRWVSPAVKETNPSLPSSMDVKVVNNLNTLVNLTVETANAWDEGTQNGKGGHEVELQDRETTPLRKDAHEMSDNNLVAVECDTVSSDVKLARNLRKGEVVRRQDRLGTPTPPSNKDAQETSDKSHSPKNTKGNLGDDARDARQPGSEVASFREGILELRGHELSEAGDHGHDAELEKTTEETMGDDLHRAKSRASLSVCVNNLYNTPGGLKSDDNGEQESLPRRYLSGSKDIPITDRTLYSISAVDDSPVNLSVYQSPCLLLESGLAGAPLGLSTDGKEISCDIVLESCDKETKTWLVSKQNAIYLSEEFGVRIARLEEIPTPKTDMRPKANQGLVNLRLFLATDKSTDANEAKWFINQAADVLRAVSSRGVFAKCLWYQGPVQRYAGDVAPTIQVIVKKIKGEDGRNLERIQEETGVMIGIVLDANNKKGIVNSARVIGLRLKCIRKAGFVEATKRVEYLLSHVAEVFSKNMRIGVGTSQDVALLKLKVDFSNNNSPSSGILTPMQKDVFSAYSPVSPVAGISPLGTFKCKLEESEGAHTTLDPIGLLPDSTLSIMNVGVAPPSLGEVAPESMQSEDEQPSNGLSIADPESKYSRPLLVSNLPERASTSLVREVFEDVFKDKLGLPSSYEGVSDMIVDVRLAPQKFCAFVEFASDAILLEVLKMYADNRSAFCGLELELGSTSSLAKLERMFLSTRTEIASKGLDYGAGNGEGLTFSRQRSGKKIHNSDDRPVRVASLRSSTDSEMEVLGLEQRYSCRDGGMRFVRSSGEKPKPLFLTELMRNASPRSLHYLFEDIIKKYINPSLGNLKGRATVLDVRYIPSRGCAFVDLATPELVDFMLDLHSRRPEVFFNMKMEIGRRPVPGAQGEEELVVKRSSQLGRSVLEESQSFHSRRPRKFQPSTSPPPSPRRNELAILEQDFVDDYDEDEEDERQVGNSGRKRRSDPERTVYADRLPENVSEGMIRRIFERVLRDNMNDEQREVLGEHTITEVRYVPTKFCAFVVFVAEELTRLVLQLYNQDEEIFENMRLKPHFHSRMEDLYRDDPHERDDGTRRVLSRDMSIDRRGSRRHLDDYQGGYAAADSPDYGPRSSRASAAHRAVAATAFKEVDRRRSVYVDRIPERLPEPAMRDLFERALRQSRHAYSPHHSVSQVTFFRDKFDPDKLCAFVELDNEDLVQELLEVYMEDEDGFSGMRVRPAVKYGN